jgi:hypothetical protein
VKTLRQAQRRFWAIVTYSPEERSYMGTVQDFYPEEEHSHKAELLRDRGTAILGTFDEGQDALAATRQFIKILCDRLNALPRQARQSQRRMRLVGKELAAELQQGQQP